MGGCFFVLSERERERGGERERERVIRVFSSIIHCVIPYQCLLARLPCVLVLLDLNCRQIQRVFFLYSS